MGKVLCKRFVRSLVLWLCFPAIPLFSADEHPMDQLVLLRIEEQLRSDIRLRDASLDIQVMAGQVTLQGELPNFVERNRLDRICRRIDGVTKVTNRITVAPVLESEDGLRRAVEQRLRSDPVLQSSEIVAQADGTIVRLIGNVASLHARRRAEWVAEQVRGVARVRNELKLQDGTDRAEVVPDRQIAESIRQMLSKDDRSLTDPIEVTVKEGVVTLEGEVNGIARKRFYRSLVERMRGVRAVENHLQLRINAADTDAKQLSIDDAALEVQLALDAAGLVPGDLRAQLANGEIAITGSVASIAQKQRVVRLAQAFASRFAIVDGMEVAIDDRGPDEIQMELQNVLQSDVLLGDSSIEVAIDQQVATLSGTVDRFADKLRAERLASNVCGIRSIENRLEVEWMATTSDEVLKQRIEDRLQRNRVTAQFAEAIKVAVDEGRVELTGRVPSWEIRREIGAVATGTDGIKSVENRTAIAMPD